MSINIKSLAQSTIKSFFNLHFPEKIWVLTHPFIAVKTMKITNLSSEISTEAITDTDLDGDYSGGQVDAFRHTLWMAMLSQKINPKKAYKLGVAHEKGNEIDYKKKTLEEGFLPDFVSCEMDLKNNNIGIEIGKNNKNASLEDLKLIVKQAVLSGECYKIKKDKNRNFLDKKGNIIPEEDWKGKWNNPKVLVKSDYCSDN